MSIGSLIVERASTDVPDQTKEETLPEQPTILRVDRDRRSEATPFFRLRRQGRHRREGRTNQRRPVAAPRAEDNLRECHGADSLQAGGPRMRSWFGQDYEHGLAGGAVLHERMRQPAGSVPAATG